MSNDASTSTPESSVKTTDKADGPGPAASHGGQNGEVKPELDEFGLPIRTKKRYSSEGPQSDGAPERKSDEVEPRADEAASSGAVKEPLPAKETAEQAHTPVEDPEKPNGVTGPKGKEKDVDEPPAVKDDRPRTPTNPEAKRSSTSASVADEAPPPPYSPTSPTHNVAMSDFSHQAIASKPAEKEKPAE
ncbi:MAG: hypothetical protein INR71_11545, partial [Terriglobus roseus]|nr:hypothetical protein [Terriglobus roseus]